MDGSCGSGLLTRSLLTRSIFSRTRSRPEKLRGLESPRSSPSDVHMTPPLCTSTFGPGNGSPVATNVVLVVVLGVVVDMRFSEY